jgi:hypothetical protein
MTSNKDFIGKFWELSLVDDARSGGVAAAGNGKGPSLPVLSQAVGSTALWVEGVNFDEPVLWIGRMTEAAGTYSKSIDCLIDSRCTCISAVVVRRGRSSPRPSSTVPRGGNSFNTLLITNHSPSVFGN